MNDRSVAWVGCQGAAQQHLPARPPSTTRACTGCCVGSSPRARARSAGARRLLHLLAAHRVAEREVLTPEALRPAGPEALARGPRPRPGRRASWTGPPPRSRPSPSRPPTWPRSGDRLAALVARHADLTAPGAARRSRPRWPGRRSGCSAARTRAGATTTCCASAPTSRRRAGWTCPGPSSTSWPAGTGSRDGRP